MENQLNLCNLACNADVALRKRTKWRPTVKMMTILFFSSIIVDDKVCLVDFVSLTSYLYVNVLAIGIHWLSFRPIFCKIISSIKVNSQNIGKNLAKLISMSIFYRLSSLTLSICWQKQQNIYIEFLNINFSKNRGWLFNVNWLNIIVYIKIVGEIEQTA